MPTIPPLLAIQEPDSSSSLVYQFTSENFFRILSKHSANGFHSVIEDRASYLFKYLEEIRAETMVAEYDYMDGDYLDDYASYYVKCYVRYKRRCVRLHFFSSKFDSDHFLEYLRIASEISEPHPLNKSYLGFIVVRPLPDAIIGRTVLKTFPSDGGRRQYRCVRPYTAHLFGIQLSIDSLAYQEQDAILAACATVSLWCCFNKTKDLFGSSSPTPAEITRAANLVLHLSRAIPTSGLQVQQICDAIKHVGLEPEVIIVQEDTPLISLIYAYVRMGIPLILGVEIEGRGQHALAIVGYSILNDVHLDPECQQDTKSDDTGIVQDGLHREIDSDKTNPLTMVGSRINKLYAHDDPIGPFSRLEVKPSDREGYPLRLEGSWKNRKGEVAPMRPKVIIIPIYHKIRLTFLHVHKWLQNVNMVFQPMLFPEDKLEWDIHLTTTNDYKRELKEDAILAGKALENALLKQQPRYIWRALFKVNDTVIGELHVDATDIARPFPFYDALWYSDIFREELRKLLETPDAQEPLTKLLSPQFIDFLRTTVGSQPSQ